MPLTPPNTLIGKKTQLELLEEKHREILRSISRDERISTYSPALKSKFDAYFDKALKQDRQTSFIVYDIINQKFVGSTRCYEICLEHKRLTIGYTWYIPEAWGTYINTECKLLLLNYAFNDLQMNRVEFCIDARNERSRAAVKKLGATEEGTLRQHIILEDGYIRDTVIYSILKSEWPIIAEKLNKKTSADTN